MAAQKIALIMNGVTPDGPNALQTALRNAGAEVDVFDVRAMHQDGEKFIRNTDGAAIGTAGYASVARIIQGGVAGDSEKSWALQAMFENAGAKPYISVDAARRITDKIACHNWLTDKNVAVFPAYSVSKGSFEERDMLAAHIGALGEPPYIVRKNIGSAALSLQLAPSATDAIASVEHYLPQSDVIIQQRPARLDAATATRYGLPVTEAENRSYQFRVILVDGKIFGANIAYSEPNGFGLNIAQGATFKPVPLASMPPEILSLAMKAAKVHGLKVAAVDIALDHHSRPRVLDMNASPDLSFANEQGETLSDAVAGSIAALALEGRKANAYRSSSSANAKPAR
jgi:hypothetical protein